MLFLMEETLNPDAYCERHYGGDASFGRLLEDIMARCGEVTVLAWTGRPSSYNSCIPASFAVSHQTQSSFSMIEDAEMDAHVAALRTSVPSTDALLIHDRVIRLPPARFANRRLSLPCVVFPVKKLVEKEADSGDENSYRARVSGVGHVEFKTSDSLSLTEPRKLVFVYPWICDLRGSFDTPSWGSASDSDESDSDSDVETNNHSAPAVLILEAVPGDAMDDHTRALRLIVRLQQPFRALLLHQQPNGGFRRIASEHDIILPGIERRINPAKDIYTEFLEIW